MTKHFDKLPVLYSCRVRLSDEQRQKLKAAYYAQQDTYSPPQGARSGGSTVTTTTATVLPVHSKLPGIVITDLLSTRESIPLTTLIQLQRAFNVTVISRDDLIKAATGYVDYMLSENDG